jgi:hypothetical protein
MLLGADYDLAIENGDFVIGEGLNQQVALLLLSAPGDIRHVPGLGVGLHNYTLDENPADLNRNIRLNFKKDGLRVNRIKQSTTELTIDAEYDNV